jgi:flavin-dependent dehydrogenase
MIKMEKHDTIIIGAGPGGLTAAKELAKKDRDVLVLERKPEDKIGDKVCGGGLPENVWKDVPSSLYKGVFTPIIHMGEIEATTQLLGMKIATVERIDLGQYQLKQAERFGAEIRGNSSVSDVKLRQNKVICNGEEIEYDNLIFACGANSRLLKRIGLKTDIMIGYDWDVEEKFRDLEFFYDVEHLGVIYAWIFPHGDHASIGSGYSPRFGQKGEESRKTIEKFFNDKGIDFRYAKKRAAPMNIAYNYFKRRNIYLIGDSASFLNVLTGEGIYQAMKSGEIAAKAIVNKEYKWRKAIKDVYRYHQVVNPALFAMNIFEFKNINPKRIQKIFGWLEGSKYGHRALSRINHRLAKSLKHYPGFATFLYLSQLYAPTTLTLWDTIKDYMEVLI